ncbi:Cellulose synthase [Quillaja saponaria]|uniref:Cellulose synthase n=1 Tax=Quillaja saponaria TaxID=32244 RepID=A0AAD7QGY4_QUISA|nr:Cellulose synthase [Quillaja saponaria]
MAPNQNSLPLHERVWRRNTLRRAMDITVLFFLILLLIYRIVSLKNYGVPWLIAFLCELWFTYNWILVISTKWSPAQSKTYPDRLLQRVPELPSVDMFVTTADPVLEPPIITVNTVLSLLAVDYPANKLACYVSDDGCSPITFYSLVEASKFAKLWVPFCKKYDVQVRAPFRYFTDDKAIPNGENGEDLSEFQQEWKTIKDEYEHLCRKIENVVKNSPPFDGDGEFAVFSNTERKNHPTIIKVLWENKEGLSGGLPHLIYVSREKRPKHPHHYKAGAMNVLARVSGVMSNAPYMLNLDCDMFVNDPKIVLHGMCILLDPDAQKEVAFAQCPQYFYDGLKDDPFGNQLVVVFRFMGSGVGGLQGPFNGGTNCFHRRKVIYGLSPPDIENTRNLSENELVRNFGSSREFINTAADALEGTTYSPPHHNLSNSIESANQVAGCGYEYGTGWGSQVGWVYGSTTEDVLTGMKMHTRGWKSANYMSDPPAFMGCARTGGPASMTQQKRWATGLLEILLSKNNPIFGTLFGKLQFRQCLAYLWIFQWGLHAIPEILYAVLPAYCLITNSQLFPKDTGLWIFAAPFVVLHLNSLLEYFETGQSIRAWWNNQRMSRIITMNAWLLGIFSVILKLLRISETVFDVTQKEESNSGDGDNEDAGTFTFNESPVFVPGTTILMVHLIVLVMKLLGLQEPAKNGNGSGPGEVFCSLYLVLCYWPFLKGLFGKGKYGIPSSTLCKAGALAAFFVHLSRRSNY